MASKTKQEYIPEKVFNFEIRDKRANCQDIEKITIFNPKTNQHVEAIVNESSSPCSISLDVSSKLGEVDRDSIVLILLLDDNQRIVEMLRHEAFDEKSPVKFNISIIQEDEIEKLADGIVIDASRFIKKSREDDALPVSLQPASKRPSYESVLWEVIKERTVAISFDAYGKYLNDVFCLETTGSPQQEQYYSDRVPFQGANAYDALNVATDCFLKEECGVVNNDNMLEQWLTFVDKGDASTNLLEEWRKNAQKLKDNYLLGIKRDVSQPLPLPYMQLIREKLAELPLKSGMALGFAINARDVGDESCYGISTARAACPTMIELIWSYWMEESLLVQTMNAITRRFQNVRAGVRDPLARMDIDPLRPMSSLLWGYIQDEPARLSLVRRAYEYDHHYGFSLAGKAVPKIKTADSRSHFLGAFHQLLNLAHRFFHAYDDTTIKADAFPLLNALREVHLILAEGAHNQYGDLPWVARKEMLMMQWMLARPEMREFIGGRIMVPQKERWMDRVDGMKRLQGWSGTATTHFVDLAQTGERLLLSIRFASWSQIDKSEVALSWAVFWRDDIQRYAHAYRAVTGVDLTDPVTQAALDAKPPSYWLLQREAS
ncbi:hypothetical protein SAMN05660964_01611 [Thiothrix caldifontis]|uniref:Uncharacterized protein n=2 Tax=Thiothrix caldifontis TaxID=525918 RepID=A0A1H4BCU1_9GAMM|nr:hypothetical protein SAMN05660964_01611 [Thiothrix caldifontis]